MINISGKWSYFAYVYFSSKNARAAALLRMAGKVPTFSLYSKEVNQGPRRGNK